MTNDVSADTPRLLSGKVALVTGGGGGSDGGIGRAISRTFAAAGATVVVVDIQRDLAEETVSMVTDSGGEALALQVDVSDWDQVQQMTKEALHSFGHIDVLVNNVGDTLGQRQPFLETSPADWGPLYDVNLRHVFLCSRSVVPEMIARAKGGAVINVSTIEAFRGIPIMAVYAAFKGGITQFTKSFALEVARHGVRVNAIAPDMTPKRQDPDDHWLSPEEQKLIPLWMPIGRFGLPRDIANVALFLASDLSAYLIGTTVHADGGTYASSGWFRTESGSWTNRPLHP